MVVFSHRVMSNSFLTPWTVVCQAPLSMGFPKQEYWSGFAILSPRDLPDPGIKPTFPALVGGFLTTEPPGKPSVLLYSRKLNIDLRREMEEKEIQIDCY